VVMLLRIRVRKGDLRREPRNVFQTHFYQWIESVDSRREKVRSSHEGHLVDTWGQLQRRVEQIGTPAVRVGHAEGSQPGEGTTRNGALV
jgi:hypothetical protein